MNATTLPLNPSLQQLSQHLTYLELRKARTKDQEAFLYWQKRIERTQREIIRQVALIRSDLRV